MRKKLSNLIWKQTVIIVFFVLAIQFVGQKIHDWRNRPDITHQEYSAEYRGDTAKWKVVISEVMYAGKSLRTVHLMLPGASSYTGITGHDYNNDGIWERIFYNGYPIIKDGKDSISGCNSVYREGSNWVFDPCESDKDIAKKFTPGQIIFASQELDEAVQKIRSPQHLIQTYLWDEASKTCQLVEPVDIQSVPFH